MDKKVLTAPLATIEVDGQIIGKMKNIRVTETFRRGRVSGLGEVLPQELPLLEWNGTLTCQFYTIDLTKTNIPKAFGAVALRNASVQEFVDTVLLQEDGVIINIHKKVKDTVDPDTGLIIGTPEIFASVVGCFIDNHSWDINESQISGTDQSFTYSKPILVKI